MLPNRCRLLERGERGQALILVTLLITVILVIGVITIDFGLVLSERNHLRATADAAALAGAVKCSSVCGADAIAAAADYASRNGDTVTTTCSGSSTVCVPPSQGPHTCTVDPTNCTKYVEVKISQDVGLEFASIFGVGNITATGRAVGTQVQAQQFYALYSHGTGSCNSDNGDIELSGGGGNEVIGRVQANGDLTTSGSNATNPTKITGVTGYGCTLNIDNNTIITPPPVHQTLDWPAFFTTSDFLPCTFGSLTGPKIDHLENYAVGSVLPSGVYCSGDVITCQCDGISGTVTLVTGSSSGQIKLQGGGANLSPYSPNHVLAFSSSTDTKNAVVLSGAASHWNGIIVAEFGGVTISGGRNAAGDTAGVIGAIMAQGKITISGGKSIVQAAYLGSSSVTTQLVE